MTLVRTDRDDLHELCKNFRTSRDDHALTLNVEPLNFDLHELRSKKIGLVLSSGFFGFYAHAGCLLALEQLGIPVQGFSGSSAGAIIAALGASGMPGRQIRELLLLLQKKDFWDPEPWHRIALHGFRLFRGWHGFLDGAKFSALLGRLLPAARFEDLRWPCVIATSNLSKKRREWISSGDLAGAVHASCAVPWLFKFKQVGSCLHVDGGFSDKAPVEGLARLMRPDVLIVHYLKSGNLTNSEPSFLSRRFSPGRANALAVSIGRHEHYLTQKRLAEAMGVRVLEITPEVVPVSPGHLELGPAALESARGQTLAFFTNENRG